jgi:hypothetical protein
VLLHPVLHDLRPVTDRAEVRVHPRTIAGEVWPSSRLTV